MENFSFVVGFDLGHGETALTMVNLKSEHSKEAAVKVNVLGQSSFITAIAYHPRLGVLVGRSALTTEGVTESHMAFKERIGDDLAHQEVLADYARHIFEKIESSSYGITGQNTLFIVGCPTDWASKSNQRVVAAYESILRDGANIPHVKVVAESRGALMNAIESGDVHIAELRGRALVVDLGSSTVDFTLVNLAQRHADPFDFGHDLGASLIDKLIFRYLLDQQKRKDELLPLLAEHSVHRNFCELECRRAKESWFNAPDSVASVFVEIIPDELEFRGRVDKSLMKKILGSSFAELREMEAVYGKSFAYLPENSWEEELKRQLVQAKGASEDLGTAPDVVLLTGSASQMSFVEPACRSVFPGARILRGPEPEYAISRGLAYWGRVDVRTQGFSLAVDRFSVENIRPEVAKNVDSLYGAVSDKIAEGVTKIIKDEFRGWKSMRYATVNGMKHGIDQEVRDWIDSQLSKEIRGCVAELVPRVSVALAEQVKTLERDYEIPVGTLGGSFLASDLGEVALRIDVPHGQDYTGGVGEALASIVGVIAGIITGVVAYVVTPIVLKLIVVIIGAVSTTLASMLVAILVSNPVGWAVLGIGIVALGAGANAAEKVKEKLPDWDLPGWVRSLVDNGSIHRKIDSRRGEISSKVTAALARQEDLRKKIVDTMTEAFMQQLKMKADEARVLIS